MSRLPIVECPRNVEELLTLVEKQDVVITSLKHKQYWPKLVTGVKTLLKFVRAAENKIYMVDCIRSTSIVHHEKISKCTRNAQHAIFFFPPALATPEKRMWRSQWKNTYLDDDQEVKYMVFESTARRINNGELLLPDVCLGEPIFLLNEGHVKAVRRRCGIEERRIRAAASRQLQQWKREKRKKKKKPSTMPTAAVMRSRRKQYLKAAEARKRNWICRGGFMDTLATVASTFASEPQTMQTVSPPIPQLLQDKVTQCPHHCGNRMLLKSGLQFGSYIKCSKCKKSIRVRFFSKENAKVSL